ncbi:Flotillin-1 [Orbilia brochopaga]|nr:Flotillin-1 [Drechslerella brochopaga]
MMWYHISEPNQYLALTGAGIDGVKIAKKAFVLPFQKGTSYITLPTTSGALGNIQLGEPAFGITLTRISITPFDFSLQLQAMTIEKLSFALPAVFTIGPSDDLQALVKYATLLTGGRDGTKASGQSHVQDIVKGIIEGETRVIVSGLTMEEIFRERQIFKQKVIQNVQEELSQFGLKIYNANVKELQDSPGNQYFSSLAQKAHESAINTARVDVAEARMKGEIGEKEKQGLTKQQISKIEAETSIRETERKKEKATAEADLTNRQTELDRDIKLARISASRAAEARDAELHRDVEAKRAATELERLRATDVTKAIAKRETDKEAADAKFYTQNRNADALIYQKTKEVEAAYLQATRAAEANYFAREKEAQANLITRKLEAEGISALAKSYGELSQALGGSDGLLKYLMLEKGTYGELARANAEAIKGLQPKINVWNTGSASGEGGAGDPTAAIRNIFQTLPPLFSTIEDQTGIRPPNWIANVPQTNGAALGEPKAK